MNATVIGSINYDIIIHQSRFCKIGETFPADNLWSGGGGKGANQATQLAKLGIPTKLIGAVGEDIYGELLLKELNSNGVNTECVNKKNTTSGMGIVTAIPNGEVIASIIPGANVQLSTHDIDINSKTIKESDIILYQIEIPVEVMEHSFQYINKDTYVVLNAAPAKDLPNSFWSKINCLVVNEVEASFYSGITVDSEKTAEESIKKIREVLSKDLTIIVTLGALGSVISNPTRTKFIPALDVKSIETTGAGDSFIGAFCAYYLENDDIFKATEFATKVASITVQGVGAQSSMPNINQIL